MEVITEGGGRGDYRRWRWRRLQRVEAEVEVITDGGAGGDYRRGKR